MKNIKVIIVLVITASATLFAQFGSEGTTDARRMALGNTSNAISKGVFSIGINPANILNSDETVNFSTVLPFPNLSVKAGTNFISLNDFNYYFGGNNGQSKVLSQTDVQNLSSLMSGGGLIFGNVNIDIFSIGVKLAPSIGAFGLSVNDVVSSNLTLPSALSQIIVNGNPTNSTYNFNDANASVWWLRDYSLTYAREIPEIPQTVFSKIAAGITLKMVQGFAYVGTQQVNSSFSTGSQNQLTVDANNSFLSAFSDNFHVRYSYNINEPKQNAQMSPFPTPAGNGFGMDFGLSASIADVWNFAVSITDIGSINWTKNTAITNSTGQYTANDLLDKSQQDSLKNKFKGTSDSTGGFSTNLPTALRLGASYKFNFSEHSWPGTLLLAMDINKGFNDMPGNSTKTNVSLGAEWKPMDWIPYLRTGVSFGGLLGFHWGVGLGIDAGVLEFNLSTLDMQTLVSPNSGKYLSVALNSRWKF